MNRTSRRPKMYATAAIIVGIGVEVNMANVQQMELTVADKAVHCAGCESRIENVLKKLPGVVSVKADHRTQKVRVALDPERVTPQAVKDKLVAVGYETS